LQASGADNMNLLEPVKGDFLKRAFEKPKRYRRFSGESRVENTLKRTHDVAESTIFTGENDGLCFYDDLKREQQTNLYLPVGADR
jgi:hypothetical protein